MAKFILAGKYWRVLGLTEVSVRQLIQFHHADNILNCSHITQFVIFTKKLILHILYYQNSIHFWVCINILNFNTLGENSLWMEQRRGSVHNIDPAQLVTMVQPTGVCRNVNLSVVMPAIDPIYKICISENPPFIAAPGLNFHIVQFYWSLYNNLNFHLSGHFNKWLVYDYLRTFLSMPLWR